MTLDNKGLGAFELHEKLGAGGMGEVWRATHLRSGTNVAVKLSYAGRGDEDAARIVLNEARVMAGVDHPNIVRILSLGDVGPTGSEFGLRSEDLFIAMEYAEGGACSAAEMRSWPELRDFIMQVLDGLAHTHAREIVHLDLKPENILRFPADGGMWRYRITDFGIAGTPENISERGDISGTLLYMSPEQVHGSWRSYGPWTDLYALGGVVWQLTTGDAPFRRKSPVMTAMANAQAELPEFEPRFAVPAAFEGWLGTLLAKPHRGRYRCAADAAAALSALSKHGGLAQATEPRATGTLRVVEQTVMDVPSATLIVHGLELAAPEPGEGGDRPDVTAPPTPDWREAWRAPDRLADAGLRLFPFRALPMLGRKAEREKLWQMYLQARRRGAPNVAVVCGPAESGKTRLTAWFVTRLRELGQAEVIIVRQGEHTSWRGALRGALTSCLRTDGLDSEQLVDHVEEQLQPIDDTTSERVARLIHDPGSFASAFEVFGVLDAFVEALARRRPVVLVFEDVEHSAFALEYGEHARTTVDVPLVIVASVDPASARPSVQTRVDALDGTRVDLTSVGSGLLREIVQVSLPLLGDDVDRLVATRSPTIARQHLAAWIERDALQPTNAGFDTSAAPQWDSLADLWEARVLHHCRHRQLDGASVLQSACRLAAIGTRVEGHLRTAIGHDADITEACSVLEALAGIRPDGDDFVFTERSTARALRQVAARRGWLAAFDVTIADRLADGGRDDRERAALLYARADEVADAIRVARGVVQMSLARDGEALFEWMESLAPDSDDPEVVYERNLSRIRQGLSRVHSGDYEGATQLFERVAFVLVDRPNAELAAELAFARATDDLYQMRYDEGLARLEQPFDYFASTGHPERIAESHSLRGDLYMFSGRFEPALEDYRAALRLFREAGKEEGHAWSLYRLGSLADEVGDFDAVKEHLGKANEMFRRLEDRNGLMLCKDILALTAFRQGQWDTARSRWCDVLEMAIAADDQSRFLCRENLGRLEAEVGDPEVALEHLDVVIEQINSDGYSMCVQWIWDAVLEAAARVGDSRRAREAFDRARADADRVDIESPFTQPTLARAVQALTAARQDELADEVRAFAKVLPK